MRVSLFITCLADQFFPEVGVATIRLLRRLGIEVDFPREQTCCGQPAFNTGYQDEAQVVARRFIDVFAESENVVAPSGSCVSMVRHFFPELLADDPIYADRARTLASRTFELSEFLVRKLGRQDVGACFPARPDGIAARVTYHDSCHSLRGLRLREEPRELIRAVRGVELVEMSASDVCCGFGGTFAVKFADISGAMLADKLAAIRRAGVEYVIATDSSCLMQIAGGLRRSGSVVEVLHLAQLLARSESP